ncbi:MAG: hypothetical protein K8R53_07725 [Bacteroidales bacterium]|nr:hypothetical protein [Bacteroidales bacterium]
MPVNIEVYYYDGTMDKENFRIKNETEIVNIENPDNREVVYVLFDPGKKVLKNVTFEKSLSELEIQAKNAPQMIDRYDALIAMRPFPIVEKRNMLTECYKNEKFHLTKSEIIVQLAKDQESSGLFLTAISDPDVLVRRTVVEHVTTIPPELRKPYEKLLSDSCYKNIELALGNLCNTFPENIDNYLETTEDEIGWRGKNIRIKWLEIAIENGKADYLDELTEYANNSYDFETRKNALSTLQKLNYLDDRTAGYLLDACLYFNFRLSGSARNNLKYFYQQNKYKKMIDNNLDNTLREQKDIQTIKKILE